MKGSEKMARKTDVKQIGKKKTPATSKKTAEPVAVEDNTVVCMSCDRRLKRTQFYKSFNPKHKTQITPFCKECWFKLCANPLGEVDRERFKEVLRMNDRPYIHELFVSSFREHKTPAGLVGNYMKRIALQQFKDKSWEDSIFEIPEAVKKKKPNLNHDFDLNELEDKWGSGYTDEELIAFEKKYRFLVGENASKSNIHDDAAMVYIRFRVKADFATARDDIAAATKWGQLAEKAQDKAKLSPDKLTKNDLSGGMDNFATWAKEVEMAVDGIVPMMPRYLEQPKDKADFIILCYVNYIQHMKGLPLSEYKDIYEFYNRRAEEVTFADDEDSEVDHEYAEE